MVEGRIIVIFCKRTHETKLNLQRFQTSIKGKYSSCVFSHAENWNLSVLPLWNFTLKAKLKFKKNLQCSEDGNINLSGFKCYVQPGSNALLWSALKCEGSPCWSSYIQCWGLSISPHPTKISDLE